MNLNSNMEGLLRSDVNPTALTMLRQGRQNVAARFYIFLCKKSNSDFRESLIRYRLSWECFAMFYTVKILTIKFHFLPWDWTGIVSCLVIGKQKAGFLIYISSRELPLTKLHVHLWNWTENSCNLKSFSIVILNFLECYRIWSTSKFTLNWDLRIK